MEDAIDVGPDDLSSGDAETLISSAIAGLNQMILKELSNIERRISNLYLRCASHGRGLL